jgi:hypothetical protein
LALERKHLHRFWKNWKSLFKITEPATKISLVVVMFVTVQAEVPSFLKRRSHGGGEGGFISGGAAGGGDGGEAGEGDGSVGVEEVGEGSRAAPESGIAYSFLMRVITVSAGIGKKKCEVLTKFSCNFRSKLARSTLTSPGSIRANSVVILV